MNIGLHLYPHVEENTTPLHLCEKDLIISFLLYGSHSNSKNYSRRVQLTGQLAIADLMQSFMGLTHPALYFQKTVLPFVSA